MIELVAMFQSLHLYCNHAFYITACHFGTFCEVLPTAHSEPCLIYMFAMARMQSTWQRLHSADVRVKNFLNTSDIVLGTIGLLLNAPIGCSDYRLNITL